MPRIEACRNITILQDLSVPDGMTFDVKINGIGFQPDEVIIRSINAVTKDPLADNYGLYLIYSNITNDDILGTFAGYGLNTAPTTYSSNPQTVIKINKPMSAISDIKFRIQADQSTMADSMDVMLSISLDFIKYKEKTKKK